MGISHWWALMRAKPQPGTFQSKINWRILGLYMKAAVRSIVGIIILISDNCGLRISGSASVEKLEYKMKAIRTRKYKIVELLHKLMEVFHRNNHLSDNCAQICWRHEPNPKSCIENSRQTFGYSWVVKLLCEMAKNSFLISPSLSYGKKNGETVGTVKIFGIFITASIVTHHGMFFLTEGTGFPAPSKYKFSTTSGVTQLCR